MFFKHILMLVIFSQGFFSSVDLLPVPQSLEEKNIKNETTTVKPLIVKSVEKSGLPEEVQMAQCTITSGDIKASAQATFSQKLENVCSTNDMVNISTTISNLEQKILTEIYHLKFLIQNLNGNSNNQFSYMQPPNYVNNHYLPVQHLNYANNHIPQPTYNNYQSMPPPSPSHWVPQTQNQIVSAVTTPTYVQTIPSPNQVPFVTSQDSPNIQLKSLNEFTPKNAYSTKSPTTTNKPEVLITVTNIPLSTTESLKNVTEYSPVNIKPIETKSLSIAKTSTKPSASKEKARKITSDNNELNYFWKLENFPKAFKVRNKKNEVYSYVFKVNGLHLRIRAHMDNAEDLRLELEHLANLNNREINVELFDGIVFKEIATEQLFQYQFVIMDLIRPNHDLISPSFWNTDTDGFLIPNSVLVLSSYTKNDSILIKLVISF